MKKAMLVYQAGIANVFEVESFNLEDRDRNAKRIMQWDFRTCENFARGLKYAGWEVNTAHCNMAGDIASQTWDDDLLEAPFNDAFRPIYSDRSFPPLEVAEYYDLPGWNEESK